MENSPDTTNMSSEMNNEVIAMLSKINDSLNAITEAINNLNTSKNIEKENYQQSNVNNVNNSVSNDTSQQLIAFDQSRLDDFIEEMEKKVAVEIHKSHKDITVDYARQRLRQVACSMLYNGQFLTSVQRQINNGEAIYNIGDEMMGTLFLKNISSKNADYDLKDKNGKRTGYIPFLSGVEKNPDQFGNPIPWSGLLDRKEYISILYDKLTILFPGTTKEDIENNHGIYTDIVYKYCESVCEQQCKKLK